MTNSDPVQRQLQKAYTATEREIEAMRMRIGKLEGIKDGIKKLLQDASQASQETATSGQPEVPATQGLGDLSNLSASKAAVRVLKDAGGPLHISEIAKRMVERGYGDKDAKKLRVTLYTTLLRSKNFVKLVQPKATFGLTKWGSAETQSQKLQQVALQSPTGTGPTTGPSQSSQKRVEG